MQNPLASPNSAHATTVAVLAAAAELGAEAIRQCMGTDQVSAEINSEFITTEDLQTSLIARLAKKLGV